MALKETTLENKSHSARVRCIMGQFGQLSKISVRKLIAVTLQTYQLSNILQQFTEETVSVRYPLCDF